MTNSVYIKLQTARIKLQAMEIKKTGRNDFAGYDYFELGDFLLPIQELFAELSLCGTVSFNKELATLRVVDWETGHFIDITSPMGSANLKGCHEVQNIGAVETYQRRYLWMAALEIVEHDALEKTRLDPLDDLISQTTLQALQDKFGPMYKAATKGKEKTEIKAAYDRRKAELIAEQS